MPRTTPVRILARKVMVVLLLVNAAVQATARADAPTRATGGDYPRFSGEANVSGQRATGNTESSSLDVGLSAHIEQAVWRHAFEFTAYQAREDGNEIADRYRLSEQSDYKFSERAFIFVRAGYERQRFGAFERRLSASTGIGRSFVETEQMQLDLSTGAGRRATDPVGGGPIEYDAIVRLHGDFVWQFSKSSEFTQSLEVESGESNTFTRSVTALKTRLVGALSWRVSYTVEHNSEVPVGIEKTDTFTSVGLAYSF